MTQPNPHIGQDALQWLNEQLASDEMQARLVDYYREAALAHFYGQSFQHQDAHLALNHRGAQLLLVALQAAIASGSAETVNLETADGEGFSLHLKVTDSMPVWEQLELPYTDADLKGDGTSLVKLFHAPSE